MSDIDGPFIVWENYGYEGWVPKSFPTLKAALCDQRNNSEFVVTKKSNFDVVEAEDGLDRLNQITPNQASS